MRIDTKVLVIATLALGGCGGSITGNGGPPMTRPDAATTIPCSAMGACACREASDRCTTRTEACWCPSECDPNIACVCGGGRFLACENATTTTTACGNQVARVQALCAGKPFVEYLANVCNGAPSCVADCLATVRDTGTCDQIDCSFCPACDCAGPATPSPLAACLATCIPIPD